MAKIFFLAGEPSGDLHGSYLIMQLLSNQPSLQIKAWGGDKMKSAGAEILRPLEDLAYMGFVEVAKNFMTILENFRLCKAQISSFDPDVIVFIDYPGFNLRMAKWAKTNGYKTIQYIAPTAWAWKEDRVKKIRKYIDELLVILPFEKAFFAKHGIDAHYVGHPLVEEIDAWKPDPTFRLPSEEKNSKLVALFPGSRLQEIKLILPKMMRLVNVRTDLQFYIAVASHLDLAIYHDYIKGVGNVHLIKANNYDLLSTIDAAIVSSGTATLEVALLNVPQVVCYQTNMISFAIAKQLVKTKYISLVNLIAGKEVVRELLQDDFSLNNLEGGLQQLLTEEQSNKMLHKYAKLSDKLGSERASHNAASIILACLSPS